MRFHSRHRSLNASEFLRALTYESAIVESILRVCGRPATHGDLERLVPVLLNLSFSYQTNAAELDDAIKRVALACADLYHLGSGQIERKLATDLVWGCTIRCPQEGIQPHYSFARRRVTEALATSGLLSLRSIPLGVSMSRVGGLVAAQAIMAPDGFPVVLLNHEVVFISDYARIRYRMQKEMSLWKSKKEPHGELWALINFLGLAERLLISTHCLDRRASLPTPPLTQIDATERDSATIARFGDSITSFIILHEFGHIAHGHLGEAEINVERSHAMEFEADQFALRVLEREATFRTSDLECICTMFNDFARARAIGKIPAASNTHPCFLERADRLVDASTRLSLADKRGMSELTRLKAIDESCVGLLIPRGSNIEKKAHMDVSERFSPYWGYPDLRRAEEMSNAPGVIGLTFPPEPASLLFQSWSVTRRYLALAHLMEEAILEIVCDPELRPPFEIEAITTQDFIVRFVAVVDDRGNRQKDHCVCLINVKLIRGDGGNVRVMSHDKACVPSQSLQPAWALARPRIRFVAIRNLVQTIYYEVGGGLILPPVFEGDWTKCDVGWDYAGNLVVTVDFYLDDGRLGYGML